MKCKPYSEITVEIWTQLKTVKITSNIFAVHFNGLTVSLVLAILGSQFAFGLIWKSPE